MKFSAAILFVASCSRAFAQVVYICGDSTTASSGGGGGTQGWGVYLKGSLSLPVMNKARGGRSARSFTDEGRFDEISNLVKPGDYVIIEFGHNDGGSLSRVDNLRTPCGGAGSETCISPLNGKVVQTFPTYLINAGRNFTSKGAKVIFSSMTPNNLWEKEPFSYTPSRFVTYANLSAQTIGGPAATFVDHGKYVAEAYRKAGKAVVDSYFPNDHTHTSHTGAAVVEKAFVQALVCAGNELAGKVTVDSQSFEGVCL